MFGHKVVRLLILPLAFFSQLLLGMDVEHSFFPVVKKYPAYTSLEHIVRSTTLETVESSLDEYLWVLKKEEYQQKEEDAQKSKDYVFTHKLSAEHCRLALHTLYFYFFDPEGEIVWRSGAFRQTYPRGLLRTNVGPVFCACLETEEELMQPLEGYEVLALVEACVTDTSLPTAILRCSDLQQHSGCSNWRTLMKLQQDTPLEEMEKMPRELLAKVDTTFQGLMNVWQTSRLLIALLQESDSELFQFGLLYDDYDFIAHCLQHKLRIGTSTFAARSVSVLELLDQYGVLDLKDQEDNTPFHYFAEHGRLVGANVLDFYRNKQVDPLVKNKRGYTPLDLLAHASFRFDSCESKLKKFVAILLQSGARGRHMSVKACHRGDSYIDWLVCQKTILDVAQETHEKWQLRATALVLDALKAQEVSDAKNNSRN